jgi:hypothetical protein
LDAPGGDCVYHPDTGLIPLSEEECDEAAVDRSSRNIKEWVEVDHHPAPPPAEVASEVTETGDAILSSRIQALAKDMGYKAAARFDRDWTGGLIHDFEKMVRDFVATELAALRDEVAGSSHGSSTV